MKDECKTDLGVVVPGEDVGGSSRWELQARPEDQPGRPSVSEGFAAGCGSSAGCVGCGGCGGRGWRDGGSPGPLLDWRRLRD